MKTYPYTQVQMYNLMDANEKEQGLAFLRKVYDDTDSTLVVYAAGGDGTFSGLLKDVSSIVDMSDTRITFSPISFGTGNGLGTVLWSSSVDPKDTLNFERFNKLITDRLECPVRKFDIWKVDINARNDGCILQNSKAGNIQCKTTIRLMTTYASFGIQGRVGYAFESHRHSKRSLNFLEYMRQSLGNCKVTCFKDYISSFSSNGKYTTFCHAQRATKNSVELVIQNLEGLWGSKVSLWKECIPSETVADKTRGPTDSRLWTAQDMGDQKLEVFGIKNRIEYVRNLFKPTRKNILRVGQYPGLTIHFRENATQYLMLDGEFFFLDKPKDISFQPFGAIQVFVNPE